MRETNMTPVAAGQATGFLADTAVQTKDAPLGHMEIQYIEVGTMVLAGCAETGERNYRPVTRTFVHEVRTVCEIEFILDNGLRSGMLTTPEHPFWVKGVGWRPAGQLQAGDRLLFSEDLDTSQQPEQFFDRGWVAPPKDPDDLYVTVMKSVVTDTESKYDVESMVAYNFEVAEFHTYYVGYLGLWVHDTMGVGTVGSTGPKT